MASNQRDPALASAPRGNHSHTRGGRGDRGNRSDRGRRGRSRGRGRGDNTSSRTAPGPEQVREATKDEGVKEIPRVEGNGEENGQEEEVEADVCFICASPVVHQAVSPCNHRTCHICALRLRALYKTRACAHCRTESKFVIFTDDNVKRFEDFTESDFDKVDEPLGIKYEKREIHDDTVLILRYNCPEPTCDIACLGWPDLHRHVKTQHSKFMCDLCTRNKKVFTHEHELFTNADLRKHEKFGDDNPGAIDQSGFKGHPECGFCRKRFYGDDELYTHCRDRHEKCHICDRRNSGRSQQYYVDYNALEVHFRKDHFLCPDTECLEKKFVVFESEMDLKAHQLESHPNGMTKDGRRDARRVDLSTFDYRTPHHHEGRGGRQRGRGRDPNAESIPPSSAQPLRRDELAFQRMAMVQSAQSTSTRAFGGQLSTPRPEARQEARPEARPDAQRANSEQLPAVGTLSVSEQSLTPQEQARKIHHTAVMERAQGMLHNDSSKISDFRNQVSSYRTSKISANGLIESFFTLFDVSSAEIGKLVRELADIYEDEAKRAELLQAWNSWRAINEDYPSLPGPSGVPSGASTGSGGRRVLKLKSSTAASSRSAVSQHASWGSPGSASNPFPPMPTSKNRAGAGRVGPVPWAGSTSTQRSQPITTQSPSIPTVRAASSVTSEAFPALPAAAKPQTGMLGIHNKYARWDSPRSTTPSNAWSAQSTSANASAGASEIEDEVPTAGGKKKGKAKKQTFLKFG